MVSHLDKNNEGIFTAVTTSELPELTFHKMCKKKPKPPQQQ